MFKLFNAKKYEENFSGMPDLAIETIKLFLIEIQSLKTELKKYLAEDNKNKIQVVIHSIRGATSYFFIDDIDLTCRVIEENLFNLADAELTTLAQQLDFQINLLESELNFYLKEKLAA